jgi:tRNA nucleotidyltransferase (CCA-adding enzyme)
MNLPPGPEPVPGICRAAREAGGRAFLVGGFVRDCARAAFRGEVAPPARDLDLEVHGLEAAALRRLLERFGRVDAVGEAFTVYKLAPSGVEGLGTIDVSLPRRDSKTGPGHKGFDVTGDPHMGVGEAARRRDFTINALLGDPLTGEVLDPFGGLEDLRAGVLRAVDARTFGEDPLRVLRGAQFAARFEFRIDPGTADLCRSIGLGDLPAERIQDEMEKLLLRSRRPSVGLQVCLDLKVVDRLFPELRTLVGCPQDAAWHPEGDVWVHTLQVVDAAAGFIDDLPRPKKLAVMLGALCHDLGKPGTTQEIDGRLRSYDHEEGGVEPSTKLLDRLNVHSVDGYDVRGQVLALVARHLSPSHLYEERDQVKDGAFRRLSRHCDLDLLYRVAKADTLGRRGPVEKEPRVAAVEWFRARVEALGVAQGPPPPLLKGRHVLELGLRPGPRVGRITDLVYELQLDGAVRTLEEAVAAARRLLETDQGA